MPAPPRPKAITLLSDMDAISLSTIASACNLPSPLLIRDIYPCTPLQSSMISSTRNETFHFVLSPAHPVEPGPFCHALRQVVSSNDILRTRIVECRDLGYVNVVTDEEHVTDMNTGFDNIEEYLRDHGDAARHRFEAGDVLFRSAYVGHHAVLTLHHAVMDYWSIDQLIQLDLSVVYAGQPPIKRPPFNEFAKYCHQIGDDAARAFWTPRFKGAPAIFPKPRSAQSGPPRVSEKTVRHMPLQRMTGPDALASSHMPLFIEAAWALTMAIYTDSESLAYGLVLSGRSATRNGIENTLGPTVTEVPIQVNLRHRTMTVDNLIKERAAALRQLQQHALEVQYGVANIAALSEPAMVAAGFQTLINIRPAVFSGQEPGNTANGNHVKLRMVWMRGYYPLQLIFSIMPDGVTVWARTDSGVVSNGQLDRILNQFEHTLRSLTEAAQQTRLCNLPLLDPHARVEIASWNRMLPTMAEKSVVETLDKWTQYESLAVEAGDGSATHRVLHSMSARIAEELRGRGVTRGTRVGFLFDKSLSAIVALVGLLKAGGICVPMEGYDEGLLSSVGAELLMTSSTRYAHVSSLVPDVFVVELDSVMRRVGELDSKPLPHGHNAKAIKTTAQDLAYILFTSEAPGARQTPVMLSHGHLVATLTSYVHRFDWQPGHRILQFGALASSQSVLEMLGALIAGGCICIPSGDEANLPSFIASARVNGAVLPPSVIRTMSPVDVPSLRFLAAVSSEAVADDKSRATWAGAVRFFRGWALDETSLLMTVGEVVAHPPSDAESMGMGTPVGCLVWITNPDKTHDLAPLGGVGEVVIECEGASGVLGAANISPPTWAASGSGSGRQYFRTGVLARNGPRGSVSPVGRASNRVTVGGQALQLEEVEGVLVGCRQLRDAVVVAKIAAGRSQLVAVVCLADPRLPSAQVLGELADHDARVAGQDAVAAWALAELPPALRPAVVHVVEELPRSRMHRVDRLAVREWLRQPPQLK
ncbi:hypothetical protein ACEQ8H_000267 [Pleosporales sp. CAS-2024a]